MAALVPPARRPGRTCTGQRGTELEELVEGTPTPLPSIWEQRYDRLSTLNEFTFCLANSFSAGKRFSVAFRGAVDQVLSHSPPVKRRLQRDAGTAEPSVG